METKPVAIELGPQPVDSNFKINEGIPDNTALGRSYCRLPEIPGISSVDSYVARFSELTKSAAGGYIDALLKTQLPPSAQSFSNISYMPNAQTAQFGILQWPGLPPSTLEKIAREHVGLQMILNMRCDEVLKYAELTKTPWRAGWHIVSKIPDTAKDKATLKEIREAEEFILNGGVGTQFANPRIRDGWYRYDFTKLLGAITRSTLTFDGIAIWTEMDENGRVSSFSPLPAQNVRLLDRPDKDKNIAVQGQLNFYGPEISNGKTPLDNHKPLSYNGTPATAPAVLPHDPKIFAVLVDETNNVVQQFTRNDLIWYVRNPRLDISAAGYGFSEVDQGIMLINGFTNALRFNCYSEDTEVLTKKGWQLFKDIDINFDEFATLNQDSGFMEWQKATAKIWEPYNGTMYNVHCRSLDMLVTPNHRLLLQNKYSLEVDLTKPRDRNGTTGRFPKTQERYRTVTAEEMYNELDGKYSEYWMTPVTAKWEGQEITEKDFITRDFSIKMSGDDYCAFMGMYLAEGSASDNHDYEKPYTIQIAQCKQSKGFNLYKNLLTKITGRDPNYYDHHFAIGNTTLVQHVKLFGADCYSKFIPEEIMNATPKQLQIFWDYYEAGDGRSQETNSGIYKTERRGKFDGKRFGIGTTSKILADQLQEVVLKIGNSAHIYVRPAREALVPVLKKNSEGKWEYNKENRKLTKTADFYDVYPKYARAHPFYITKIEYNGYIGCVSVPNGTLYVRRNNHVSWSRNCDIFDKNSVPKGILLLKGNFAQRQMDALSRIWDNLQRGARSDWTLPAIQISEKGSIEVISLEPLRAQPAYYAHMINLFFGIMATLYRFPVHKLGYKISGTEKDARREVNKQMMEEDDEGLPVILGHIENLLNIYLIGSRWPNLKFEFTGKTPKEDARLYEAEKNAMTWDQMRERLGWEKVADTVESEKAKELAEIMGMCPLDPNLSGVFQTLIAAMFREEEGGKDLDQPGNTMSSKKDPAKSETKGHISGVRRNSRQEKDNANETKKPPYPGIKPLEQSGSTRGDIA